LALGLRRSPAAALAAAWIAALLLAYAPQGVFFPRETYLLVAPFAVLVGIGLAGPTLAGRVGAVLALARIAWQSPVLRGADPVQAAAWRRNDALRRDMGQPIGARARTAPISVVVPYYERPDYDSLRAHDEPRSYGRQLLNWLGTTEGLTFGPAVFVTVDPSDT